MSGILQGGPHMGRPPVKWPAIWETVAYILWKNWDTERKVFVCGALDHQQLACVLKYGSENINTINNNAIIEREVSICYIASPEGKKVIL
jgi:hypothetical protein